MTSYPVWRALLALFFTVGGVLHFVFPDVYIAIMPHWLAWHVPLVFISGVCEIAGGAGILIKRTRRAAGVGLILLSIAVLPANVQMLLNAYAADKEIWEQGLLFLRLPLQAALIFWIWRVTQPAKDQATARRSE